MRSNPEIFNSLKSNFKVSKICLEGMGEGIDNLLTKKYKSLGEFAMDTSQIALSGIGYYIFGNLAVEDVKELGENFSQAIEESKKPTVNTDTLSFLLFGIPSYRPRTRKIIYRRKFAIPKL